MSRITWTCLLALLTACAAPETEDPAEATSSPTTAKVANAEMMAEPIVSPETCKNGGDGIGGTGCPIE